MSLSLLSHPPLSNEILSPRYHLRSTNLRSPPSLGDCLLNLSEITEEPTTKTIRLYEQGTGKKLDGEVCLLPLCLSLSVSVSFCLSISVSVFFCLTQPSPPSDHRDGPESPLKEGSPSCGTYRLRIRKVAASHWLGK
jgi:hypothetical protein